MSQDIRFIQRFNNFLRAFERFTQAIELANSRELSDLEKQGLIQSFEYTHELSWKVLKDFLAQKEVKVYGSRDATREAFKEGLINNGEIWMAMIQSRNETSHTYNQEVSEKIVEDILTQYVDEFRAFKQVFERLTKESSV